MFDPSRNYVVKADTESGEFALTEIVEGATLATEFKQYLADLFAEGYDHVYLADAEWNGKFWEEPNNFEAFASYTPQEIK